MSTPSAKMLQKKQEERHKQVFEGLWNQRQTISATERKMEGEQSEAFLFNLIRTSNLAALRRMLQKMRGMDFSPNLLMSRFFWSELLDEAAHQGNVAVIKFILQEAADLINLNYQKKDTRCTCLMTAAHYGRPEAVKLFLTHAGKELNVNIVTPHNKSALLLCMISAVTLYSNHSIGWETKKDVLQTDPKEVKENKLSKKIDTKISNDVAKQGSEHGSLQEFLEIISLLVEHDADISLVSPTQETALILSLFLNSVDLVKQLIAKKANVNVTNKDGNTPLMFALDRMPQAFDLIFDQKPTPINAEDVRKCTALTFAANIPDAKERFRIIKALLSANADPSLGFFLFRIIEIGDVDVLSFTLSHCKDLNLSKLYDSNKRSLLASAMVSTRVNREKIVKMLLDTKQFNIEEKNEKGETLFFTSLFYHMENISLALLEAGADPCSKRKDGGTPLMQAASMGQSEILARLLKTISKDHLKEQLAMVAGGYSAVHLAVIFGHLDCLKMLLEAGADLSPFSEKNESALFLALRSEGAQNCLEDLVKVLLQFATKEIVLKMLNTMQGSQKDTPLTLACYQGDLTSVQLFLEAGADPNMPGEDNYPPFVIAAARGHSKILKLLLAAKAPLNIDFYTDTMRPALVQAIFADSPDCIDVLLDAKANIELKDMNEDTPLLIATHSNKPACVRKLIERKADIESKEKEGVTALHSAIYWGHHEVFRLLLEAGANSNTKTNQGFIPIMTAAIHGKTQVIKLLCDNPKVKVDLTVLSPITQFNLIQLAANSDTVEMLNYYGVEGQPFMCYVELMGFVWQDSEVSEAVFEKYIRCVDVTLDFRQAGFDFFEDGESFNLLSCYNAANKPLKSLMLKYKIYKSYDKSSFNLNKAKIDQFFELFKSACDDFKFADDGSILIIFNKNNTEYTLSISDQGVKYIISLMKADDAGNLSTKKIEALKDLLKKHANENKLILEGEEINVLKDNLATKRLKCNRQIEKNLAEIKLLKEALESFKEKPSFDIEKIEENYAEFISKLEKVSHETNTLLRATLKQDPALKTKIEKDLADYQALDKSQDLLLQPIKKLYLRLKERALQGNSKEGKSNKQKRKQKGHQKKKIEAHIPTTSDLNVPSKKASKADIAASNYFQRMAQFEPKNADLNNKAKHLITFNVQASMPKAKPEFLRSHLCIPKHTLERATNLGSRLRANQGLNDFNAIVQGNEEIKETLDPWIQVNALKGAMGHALENRIALNEGWVIHIRTSIFKNDKFFKQFLEVDLIAIITRINANINEIFSHKHRKTLDKLPTIEEFDEQDFLKKLLEKPIPKFSLEFSRLMIRISKDEIEIFRKLLRGNHNLVSSNVFIKALGFTWACIGTHLDAIAHNEPGQPLDPCYLGYRQFAIEYRHDLPFWKPKVVQVLSKELERLASFKLNPNAEVFVPQFEAQEEPLLFQYKRDFKLNPDAEVFVSRSEVANSGVRTLDKLDLRYGSM